MNKISILILLLLTPYIQPRTTQLIVNPQTFDKKSCLFITKFFTKNGIGSLKTTLSVKETEIPEEEASLFLYTFTKPNSKLARRYKKDNEDPEFCDTFQGKYDSITEYHTELKIHQGSVTNSRFGINTENKEKKPVEYFFYLCDCTRKMKEIYKRKPSESKKTSLRYTVSIVDEDDNHHGAETKGIIKVISFFLFVFSGILSFGVLRAYNNKLKNDVYDYPYIVLIGIAFIMICGLTIKLIHNAVYSYNGTGVSFLEVISRCWLMAADSTLSFLLILMVRGWGTKFLMLGSEYEPTLFVILITILVRYGWTVHAWFQYHEDVYHIFEGYAGFLEIAISVFKYLWFLLFWKRGKLGSTKKYKEFSRMLFFLSSILFFVRPLAVLFVSQVKEVRRYSISLFGILGANALVVFTLMVLFGNESGTYMKVAYSNRVKIQMTHDDEEDEHFHN